MFSKDNEGYIRWLENVEHEDIESVGAKNATLGDMMRNLKQHGIPFPQGFATTAQAYRDFIHSNNLERKMRSLVEDYRKERISVEEVSRSIRHLFKSARFPGKVAQEMEKAYDRFSESEGRENPVVAVRSSATAEDLPEASFAGMLESFLNVRGKAALLEACVCCYASLFSERAIIYREEMGFDHMQVSLSVSVQRMLRSDKGSAGVMFSVDKRSGFPNIVLISAAWGLGENVVQGVVIPDIYKVFKPLLVEERFVPIVEKLLGDKGLKRVFTSGKEGGTENVETPPEERERFVLEDEEIVRLARWACLIEKLYKRPMDIEWAKDGMDGKLYIVQARPVTGIDLAKTSSLVITRLKVKEEPLLNGVSVGDGIVTGVVSLIESHKKIKQLKESAILVSGSANTQWVTAIRGKHVKGIVTDFGGRNSHSAIIGRELGIPAVIGTLTATEVLNTGQEITLSCVEGEEGSVYDGILESIEKKIPLENIPDTDLPVVMNAVSEDAAYKWWRIPCDGIGTALLNMTLKHTILVHPMALLHPDRVEDEEEMREIEAVTKGFVTKEDYFVDQLSAAVAEIAASRYPAPVVVQFSDLTTEEYAALKGGTWFEPQKTDTRFGFRGASRYLSDHFREAFVLECRALKRARELLGLENIHAMIPYCTNIEEADQVLAILDKEGLVSGSGDFKVHLSCDFPGNIKDLRSLCSRFYGIFFPARKLRRLFLSEKGGLEKPFKGEDEDLDFGVELKKAVDIAHHAGSRVIIGGQNFAKSRQLITLFLKAGIDALSVDPEWIPDTKRLIASIEKGKEIEV
jgi:pyruvate, water dikinase